MSFHVISVLLIRSVKHRGSKAARKVADITVSNLVVDAVLGEEQSIDGSLGGLAVLDLTPEGQLYKAVFTCGYSVARECFQSWAMPGDVVDGPSVQSAFLFSLLNPTKGGSHSKILVDAPSGTDVERSEIARNIQLKVHIASAQYVYTHRFVSELVLCAGDYAGYAAELGESLKQAASSVAMNLVSKKRALAQGLGYLSSSFINPLDSSTHDARSVASEDSRTVLLKGQDFEDGGPTQENRRVYVTVTVESPVVHVPRTSRSTERVVAQLGRIVIANTHFLEISEEQGTGAVSEFDVDRLFVEITDMSLYLLFQSGSDSLSSAFLSDRTLTDSGTHTHVLHKTAFHLTLDRRSEVCPEAFYPRAGKPSIHVHGQVATPLKLELSTLGYKELLQTLDNLGGGKESSSVPPPFCGASSASSPASPKRCVWEI